MFLDGDFKKFIVIYESKNLSKAADQLDTYQGALSKVLSRLESNLGEILFVRSNRGLVPTEMAHVLYSTLNQQNEIWGHFNDRRKQIKQEPHGVFRVGGHSVVLRQFSGIFSSLMEAYPKVEFDFQFVRSPQAARMVQNHELDFAIVVDPAPFDELVRVLLKKEIIAQFGKVGSKSKGLVFYSPEIIYSKSIKKTKFRLVPVNNYEMAAELASSTNNSAIVPYSVAKRAGLTDQISNVLQIAKIHLVYRSDYRFIPGIKWFVQEIKNANL